MSSPINSVTKLRASIYALYLGTMFLSTDALPPPSLNSNISETVLNKDILYRIEDDLDIDEKISILFLMINDYHPHSFQDVYDLLQKHQTQKAYILVQFVDKYPKNWKNRLLEAICVIQNQQIIRKLGLSFQDLNLLYLPKNRSCSRNLNLIAKCLYALCEALTEENTKALLQYVRSDLVQYHKNLENIDYLELHILYWIQENYISIHLNGKGGKLTNFLKHLKRFEDLELIYEELKEYETHENVLDIQHLSSSSTAQLQTFSMQEDGKTLSIVREEDVKSLHNGLCIIISQKYFESQKFETRFGTLADCINLSETFKSFGFTVQLLNNVKKCEILKKLEDIPKEYGTDYDCIFVCILSHGCKGGIISSDEKEVSIESIEHKFCSIELKDVIKVVIIQACQGKLAGQVNYTSDINKPVNCNASNILAYKNFCIFMSTMQGFVSVRHKEEGSWFIQEFCNILQNNRNKLTFFAIVSKTIQSVMEKRGKLNGINYVAQLPELRSCRLLKDFYFPHYRPNK